MSNELLEQFTGKAGAEQFAALVAAEQAKIDAANGVENGNIAKFDADMRAAGIQRTDAPPEVQVDQRALTFLQNWRRDNPNPTTAQLALWEKDLASVMQGRRYAETPTAFRQRMEGRTNSSGEPEGEPVPEQQQIGTLPLTLPAGVEADDAVALSRVEQIASKDGIEYGTLRQMLEEIAQHTSEPERDDWLQPAESLQIFDYTITPPEGLQLNRADPQLYAAAKVARANGISQETFNRLLVAYFVE